MCIALLLVLLPSLLANGVSFLQCKSCYFAENRGNNTSDEYGAAVAIYRVNQFENRDAMPRYEFSDWYALEIIYH